jgi:hypothetical protein
LPTPLNVDKLSFVRGQPQTRQRRQTCRSLGGTISRSKSEGAYTMLYQSAPAAVGSILDIAKSWIVFSNAKSYQTPYNFSRSPLFGVQQPESALRPHKHCSESFSEIIR